MRKVFTACLVASAIPLASTTALSDGKVYGSFPVTVKDYSGKKTNSVSYSGQIARQVLHDSLKKLAGQGEGAPNPTLKAKLMAYYAGKNPDRAIVAPKTKGAFVIEQTLVDQISKGKDLAGKTYKGAIAGMPNNMTGRELVEFWIDKASSAKKGIDLANGYNYPQLISKFIMGAVFYNQAVDIYLDENLSATKKPNSKPYSKGAPYTGKEHSWDEAFGYFGVPHHGLTLSADEIYGIAKQKADYMAKADANRDGRIDLYKEMVFAPAYYAASYDRSGKTDYLKTITRAFLDGRKLLASADGAALSSGQRTKLINYAAVVESNWEKSLAESVFKYAGSVYKDLAKLMADQKATRDSKVFKNYVKHWGELKGFSLALQTGRKNLGETSVRLNRMIGFGPVLLNSSQVVDIDSKGKYVKGEASGLGEYSVHMLKVQKLMIDKFGVGARVNDRVAQLDSMIKKMGSGEAAEND